MNGAQTMREQEAVNSLHTGGVTGSIPVAPTIQTRINPALPFSLGGVHFGSAEPTESWQRFVKRMRALFNRAPYGWAPREELLLRDAFEWLLLCRRSGDFSLRMHTLPGDDWAKGLEAARQSERLHESAQHMIAKVFVADWLRAMGSVDPQEETTCAIGRADVFCPHLNMAVEIGQTAITKFYRAALTPDMRFALVPFRRKDRKPKAIEFIITDRARRHAQAIDAARLDHIAAAIARI